MGKSGYKYAGWLFGILSVFLISRMATLMSVPIFIDEAIHLQWAKEAAAGDCIVGGGHWKWLSIQTYGLVLRICKSTLFSARLLHAMLGLATVVALFAIGRTGRGRDGQISGLASALLYAMLPFALFYDRMALTDGFLTLLLALIFLFTFKILDKPTRRYQVLLGVILCLSPMFKGNGLFFIPFPIVISMVVAEKGERVTRLRKLFLSYALAVPVAGLFLLSALRLAAPISHMATASMNQPIYAWLKAVAEDIEGSFSVFWSMLSPPVILGLMAGSVALIVFSPDEKSRRRCAAGIAVGVFLISPYVALFNVWFPRYYVPLLVPICIIGGEVWLFFVSLVRKQKTSARWLIFSVSIFAFVIPVSIESVRLSFFPLDYPLPAEIRRQFFTGWPSGSGLAETVEEIRRLSDQHSQGLNLLRSPGWDIPLQGLDAYAGEIGANVNRITLHSRNPKLAAVQISEALDGSNPTYMLFDGAFPYPGDRELVEGIRNRFQVEEWAYFARPDGNPGLTLWRLRKNPAATISARWIAP